MEENNEKKILEINGNDTGMNSLETYEQNKGIFGVLRRNFSEYKIQKEQEKIARASKLVQDNFSTSSIFNEVKTTTRNTPFNDGLYFEFKTEDQIKRSL